MAHGYLIGSWRQPARELLQTLRNHQPSAALLTEIKDVEAVLDRLDQAD